MRNRSWYEEIVRGMEDEFQKNRLWLAFKYVGYLLDVLVSEMKVKHDTFRDCN